MDPHLKNILGVVMGCAIHYAMKTVFFYIFQIRQFLTPAAAVVQVMSSFLHLGGEVVFNCLSRVVPIASHG